MRFRTFIGTALAFATVPGLSLAEFNYTSAEFNYADIDLDLGPINISGDGFSIGGTFEVADSFFIGGSYADYDFDFNLDGDALQLGGGYFHGLNEDLDFVATLSYVDVEVSGYGESASDDGLALSGGIRARLADAVEVDAFIEHVDMDKGDSDTGIGVNGRYYFGDEFAIQAGYSTAGDTDVFSIGIRGEF